MGTVIYAASPVQAFGGSLQTILFLGGLGVLGIALAILQRNRSRGARIGMGVAGGFLLIVSIVLAALTFSSVSRATQSVALKLDNKRVVQDNCGDNGQTCARYVLESATSTTAYDFDVPPEAYDKAQVDTCYQITYYPNGGLFGNSNASYQEINSVSRIETADPSRCQ